MSPPALPVLESVLERDRTNSSTYIRVWMELPPLLYQQGRMLALGTEKKTGVTICPQV